MCQNKCHFSPESSPLIRSKNPGQIAISKCKFDPTNRIQWINSWPLRRNCPVSRSQVALNQHFPRGLSCCTVHLQQPFSLYSYYQPKPLNVIIASICDSNMFKSTRDTLVEIRFEFENGWAWTWISLPHIVETVQYCAHCPAGLWISLVGSAILSDSQMPGYQVTWDGNNSNTF